MPRHPLQKTTRVLLASLTSFALLSPGISEAKTVLIECSAHSKDGQLVVSSRGYYGCGGRESEPLQVKDKKGQLLFRLGNSEDILHSLAISDDQRFVAGAGDSVNIWDLKSKRRILKFGSIQGTTIDALAFSKNLSFLVLHRSNRSEIELWDLPTTKKIKVLKDKVIPRYLKGLHFLKTKNQLRLEEYDSKKKAPRTIQVRFTAPSTGQRPKRSDEQLWKILLSADLDKAYQELAYLQQDKQRALRLVRRVLPTIFPPKPPRAFPQLLRALDSESFEEREQASQKLKDWRYFLGLKALDLSKESVEVRFRIKRLLNRDQALFASTKSELKLARCQSILSHIKGADAQELLQSIPIPQSQARVHWVKGKSAKK